MIAGHPTDTGPQMHQIQELGNAAGRRWPLRRGDVVALGLIAVAVGLYAVNFFTYSSNLPFWVDDHNTAAYSEGIYADLFTTRSKYHRI